METRRVLIVGAGIAGLATALRLRRSGWDVLLVERAAGLRGGGYLVMFSGVGFQAAQRWGLTPARRDLECPATDLVHVDRRGRQYAMLPASTQRALLGDETISLARGDLEAALFKALDDTVDLRFGTTVTGIAQDAGKVTATLSDGTAETVDLLVGADGLHSDVRTQVFGPEEDFRLDFGHLVATYSLDRFPEPAGAERSVGMNLVRRSVGVYSLGAGRPAGFFAFASTDLDADLAAGVAAALRRAYGDLDWLVPDLLDQAADGAYFDRVGQIAMDRWSNGRVVLVGDAAWCVSPYAGYGSSLAVGGADLLGQQLDECADLDTALANWEQRLRPEVLKKQQQGRRSRNLFVAQNRVGLWLQATMNRVLGSRLTVSLIRRFVGAG